MKDKDFCWLVAYIDAGYISSVEDDLKRDKKYKRIKAYIPTVKVLKKTFKGENQFEEVPLLFNYGFFKIPREFAINRNFLDQLKEDVKCIFAWVRDPAKVFKTKPILRMDEKSRFKNRTNTDVEYATASSKQIATLLKNTFDYSDHDAEDLDKLKPGQTITLHGYPWENIKAEVMEINKKKREVKVNIRIFDQVREVMVSFDNVFFSVYKSHDASPVYAGSMDISLDNSNINKETFKKFKNESGRD